MFGVHMGVFGCFWYYPRLCYDCMNTVSGIDEDKNIWYTCCRCRPRKQLSELYC